MRKPTGDINVDFPEDIELDVGTEADNMVMMSQDDNQQPLLDGSLSNDSDDTQHSDIGGHNESAIIKSEIFDPAYDMHQFLVSGPEYDFGLMNGIDSLHPFNMKSEEESLLDNEVNSALRAEQLAAGGVQPPMSLMPLPANCLGSAVSLPSTSLVPASIPDSMTTPTHTNAINNAIIASPLLLPTAGAHLNSAVAQIAKIEPGADGKGYVLHLSIPTLSGGQVAMMADGLPFLASEPQLLMANANPIRADAAADLINPNNHSVLTNDMSVLPGQLDSTNVNMSPTSENEEVDPVAESPNPESERQSGDEGLLLQSDQELQDSIDTVQEGTGQDNLVSNTLEGNSCSSGTCTNKEEESRTVTDESGTINSAEDPDVERFVICSDGPMECVLCSFKNGELQCLQVAYYLQPSLLAYHKEAEQEPTAGREVCSNECQHRPGHSATATPSSEKATGYSWGCGTVSAAATTSEECKI